MTLYRECARCAGIVPLDHPALRAVARWLNDHADAGGILRRRHAHGWDPSAYVGQEGQYPADCAAIEALIAALEGADRPTGELAIDKEEV